MFGLAVLGVDVTNLFFPREASPPPELFRTGPKGTHSSLTLMLSELKALSSAAGLAFPREAIVEQNVLGKATASGRLLTFQRLRELYSFDHRNELFNVLKALVEYDQGSVGHLALLVGLARDPLLRATARPVLGLAPGSQLMRDTVAYALSAEVGPRLNAAVLDKVVRNTASTWTQTGHLEGRTIKRRRWVATTPVSLALALWLGTKAGLHGEDLLKSGWVQALDLDVAGAKALAERAHAARLIVFRPMASGFELDVSPLNRMAAR